MCSLREAHAILISKKEEMARFFNHYLFDRAEISPQTFVTRQESFMRFIKFCLSTRRMPVNADFAMGLRYFSQEYHNILEAINNANLESLKSIIYAAPGVGQKIGSMIIEFVYLYSNYQNEDLLRNSYLPIDTHTKRVLENSFGIDVPSVGISVTSNDFIIFQNQLNNYCVDNKSRVYFDYLWFIGKVFCTKTEGANSRGYRLCNYCWINRICNNAHWV